MSLINTSNKKKKRCVECKLKIHRENKGVAMITFEKGDVLDERYFHFECFTNWFNRCVNLHAEKKIEQAAPKAFKKVMGMLPDSMQNLLGSALNDGDKTPKDNSS